MATKPFVLPSGIDFYAGDGTAAGAADPLLVVSDSTNKIGINSQIPSGTLDINTASATDKGLIVRGVSAQSSSLVEVQNSSSGTLASINPSGNISGISASYSSGIFLSSGIPNSATSKLYASGTTLYWNGSAVGGAGGNPNSYVAGFGTSGWIPYYNSTSGIAISSGQSIYIGTVTAPLNTSRALIVRGAASQSANIFEAQNSSSGALLAITSSGAISGAMSPTILTSSGGLTLTDAHHGYIIEQTGVSASGTFTIGSPSIPGWNCMIVNIGSGVVISSGSNTMRSPGGLNKSRTQYSSISIYRRGTNDFVLGGDLA
jgi:hypothetical protein